MTWAGACTVAVMSGGAWWLGGAPVAAGVAGGGAIALVNFRWLARDVARAVSMVIEGRGGPVRTYKATTIAKQDMLKKIQVGDVVIGLSTPLMITAITPTN